MSFVSVIVPTYKENANLRPLVTRLFAAVKARAASDKSGGNVGVRVIVVDDNSRDGSVETVAALAKEGYDVRIIVRETERGLSSAVLRGFDEALPESRFLICMDADLQHPPEDIPNFIRVLRGADAPQFVLGTRYAPGTAIDGDWPLHRRIISAGARLLARPLSPLSDPMSGFFAVDAALYKRTTANINPVGFKIALEIFVKSQCAAAAEVPINFGVRTAGESKLTGKVMVMYLLHLYELYMFKMPMFLPLAAVILVMLLYNLVRFVVGF
jgi:dolichol-phosphate mannosyltransferase